MHEGRASNLKHAQTEPGCRGSDRAYIPDLLRLCNIAKSLPNQLNYTLSGLYLQLCMILKYQTLLC